MTEVNSKSELKAALKRGETEFHTTNKNLLYGSALVEKFKSIPSLPIVGTKCTFEPKYTCGIVSETTIIIISSMVLLSAIALFAIYEGFDVEVNLREGTISAHKK